MSDDSDAPFEDPLVGQVIQERFRVDAKLGQGGMGAIYLAEHLLLKKKVALKCLHAGLASNPEVVRRFKNEAVAASSIGHPNIVDVMDMGRFADGTFFMVLEYLEGRDFQEKLDRLGPQSPATVAHIGMQTCAALGAAASKGIVHRDLKPENIFLVSRLGDEHFVKVLDFGISKILDDTGGATKTGQLMGTPYYMAPEQVMGEKDITHLADVYSLGVIFFQALSGSVPFEGSTLAQIVMKIATQPTPKLRERVPDAPAELGRLVDRMLEKDPTARPQTFHEVASGLMLHLDESSRLAGKAIDASTQTVLGAPAGVAPGTSAAATSLTRSWSAQLSTIAREPKWLSAAAAFVGVAAAVLLMSPGDEAAESESEAAASAQKETVRLQIATVPKDAQLLLDGEPVENPFDRRLDHDDEIHELVAESDGYQKETRKVLLTASQNLVIPLSKKAEPKAAASPEPAPRPSSTSSPSPSPSPAPSSGSSSKKKAPKPIRDIERGLKKLF